MRSLATICVLATACGGSGTPPDAAPAVIIDASPCAFAITPTTRAFTTVGAAADPNSVCGPHTNTAAIVVTSGCAWSAVAACQAIVKLTPKRH